MWPSVVLPVVSQVRLLGMHPRPVPHSMNTKANPVFTPNPSLGPSVGQGAADALRSWQKTM